MTVYDGTDAHRGFPGVNARVQRGMKHVHSGSTSTAISREIGNNGRGAPRLGSDSLSPCAMSRVAARWLANTTALAAAMLVTSCAVGPDFLHPAAPEITRYTREPMAHTSSTDVASGQRQTFVPGRDIPEQWWALFRSPRLNELIEQDYATTRLAVSDR